MAQESQANVRRTILYISTNDGSDTRITKEVRTLATQFAVIFLGVGDGGHAFIKSHCLETHLVRGKRNRPLTVVRQWACCLRILFRHRITSIHIVNEQLLILFYPLLWFRHTVLDIFDSMFLRWNRSGEHCRWLKRLVYGPANVILVTDENRKRLLPEFAQAKSVVLENYPPRYHGPIVQRSSGPLTLLFAGSLAMPRGGQFVQDVLVADPTSRVIMAGWLYDDGVGQLARHARADYRGVLPQLEILRIAATEVDYIVCIYPATNENNRNASPNKIWDAVQTHTPVIINDDVKASQLVQELNIGVVLDQNDLDDVATVVSTLSDHRDKFSFSANVAEDHTWAMVENRLVGMHSRATGVNE